MMLHVPEKGPRRLLLVQYGDYRGALAARRQGLPETYRAQYHSLDAIDHMVGDGQCLVICLDLPPQEHHHPPYHIVGDRFMPQGSGLSYIWQAQLSLRRIVALAHAFAPTCAIIRTPGWVLSGLGQWAVGRGIPVLPLLADYFPAGGLLARLRRRAVITTLHHPLIPVVANHNYPASRTLVAAGVPADKVVPWDWPVVRTPAEAPLRIPPAPGEPLRLLYVGLMLHSKGVPDIVHAVIQANAGTPATAQENNPTASHGATPFPAGNASPAVELDLCGTGPNEQEYRQQIAHLGLGGHIRFHGQVPNTTVIDLMHKAHAVVVASRPDYPEGLPNVIYEALETRTPLLCSAHPSFSGRMVHQSGCLMFAPGDTGALAAHLHALRQPDLYTRLTQTASEAWQRLQCPVTFAGLLAEWDQWLRTGAPMPCLSHSLAHHARQEEQP